MLAFGVLAVEGVAYLVWLARWSADHWAHPWKGEWDIPLLHVVGAVLAAGAAAGWFVEGWLVTAISESLVAAYLATMFTATVIWKISGPRPAHPVHRGRSDPNLGRSRW